LTGVGEAGSTPSVLRVRPVTPPDGVRNRAGVSRALAKMSPEEVRLQAERLRRWRARPDLMSNPRADWSPRPRRGAGGRGESGPGRDPNRRGPARTGAASAGPQVVRVAFIRIDFASDRGGDASTGDGRFDLSIPPADFPPIDPPPRNASFYRTHLEAL